MRARLIAVGERMPAWVAEGFAEYRKRLSHDLPLELVEIKPGARGKGRDDARATLDEGVADPRRRCPATSTSSPSMGVARHGPARISPGSSSSGA